MKKIALLLVSAMLLFARCTPVLEPKADFDASQTLVATGDVVSFINYSTNATDFEWDFGDGFTTNIPEPTHYYQHPGIYTVRLAAYKNDMVNYYTITIEVAQLSIQVLEYTKKYAVEGATITLYATYSNWLNQSNPITATYTVKDGIALIGGLAPGHYYLDVWQKYHDNYTLAKEDVGFIETPYIDNSATTYFTAWVDYTTSHSLKSAPVSPRQVIIQSSQHRVYSTDLK
ncbi:MAG: PKD domain-containing protein [Bacteroidota bacterium]|nr:PKD domain-containing protein [Bacteroidota bacterium]